ncbi:MAG TPA: DoxX family protein [Opitutaceae bacterium]|nr:DoxX family protein [Opitutaceae bacterium]
MNAATSISADSSAVATRKPFSRRLPAIARILMGLPLFVFGLNGFLNFIPQPKVAMPEGAMAFAGALANSGYMMQLIGATLLIVGTLLLINRFVPLALALFAPFIVNSIAFHIFLEHTGLPMAGVFLAFELYLAWAYRDAFRPMLAACTTPS